MSLPCPTRAFLLMMTLDHVTLHHRKRHTANAKQLESTRTLFDRRADDLFPLRYWPAEPWHYLPIHRPSGDGLSFGSFKRQAFRLGLDLQGGTLIVLQADTNGLTSNQIAKLPDTLQETEKIIGRRVNNIGVAEPEIQLQGGNRISWLFPESRPTMLRSLVGRTAELQFKAPVIDPATGKQAERTRREAPLAATRSQGARWTGPSAHGPLSQAGFLCDEPKRRFALGRLLNDVGGRRPDMGDATAQLIGKPMAIFLDNDFISAPVVQAKLRITA